MANIHRDKRRGTWQIRRQITADGRTHKLHRFLPRTATKSQIHEAAAALDRQAELIRSGQPRAAVSFQAAVDRWKLVCCRYTPRTRSEYQTCLEAFSATLPPFVRLVSDVKPCDIENYQVHRLSLGNKARTANYHLVAIKSFFRWAARFYGIANPAAEVRTLPEDPPESRFLTPDEYRLIIKESPTHARLRIQFLAHTGLRATEFCSLQWNQIAADRRSLTLIGKGRKRRTIPLNDTCRRVLDACLPAVSTHIFISQSNKRKLANKPITRKTLYNMCRDLAARLNLEPFGPHAFRHYFATRLLLAGIPLAKVSRLLGHASIKVTEQIYIHILPADLAGITDCLERLHSPHLHIEGQ